MSSVLGLRMEIIMCDNVLEREKQIGCFSFEAFQPEVM